MLFLLAFAILATALPAAAREPQTKDGKFTIFAFQNFEKCELFSARAIGLYRFSAEDKRILKELRHYAAATRGVTVERLEQSFGKPSKILSPQSSERQDDCLVSQFGRPHRPQRQAPRVRHLSVPLG
jgi:hypothetical protein